MFSVSAWWWCVDKWLREASEDAIATTVESRVTLLVSALSVAPVVPVVLVVLVALLVVLVVLEDATIAGSLAISLGSAKLVNNSMAATEAVGEVTSAVDTEVVMVEATEVAMEDMASAAAAAETEATAIVAERVDIWPRIALILSLLATTVESLATLPVTALSQLEASLPLVTSVVMVDATAAVGLVISLASAQILAPANATNAAALVTLLVIANLSNHIIFFFEDFGGGSRISPVEPISANLGCA